MFDFIKNEHEVLKLWREKKVYEKMRDKNAGAKNVYRTLDGPITANNSMCIHHVWGRTFKDVMIKYNTMRGNRTHFQNGFDAQGMWVEVEVEKDLGIKGKTDIVKYGLEKFTEKCLERVKKYSQIQTNQSMRLGQIMNWKNSYYTNSDPNIEGIWNFLKVCHERNMLVKSYKAMPWCPRCGTSLSEHEMNGQYKELTHKAVFVKADLGDGTKIVVWTTTPWTLAANVAIAVNPKIKYALVDFNGEKLILAKEAMHILKSKTKIKPVKEFFGKDIVGKKYTPMLKMVGFDFERKIIPWDDVSAKDGSGAVHIAPGCGAEDFELGKKLNLKQIIPVDEGGCFTNDFDFLKGLSTVECEAIVFEKLEKAGSLLYTHDHSHSYPFCWRCKTNVIFRLVDGWDIATDGIRPQLLAAAKKVNWQPPFIGKTMNDWLTNMGDWNISRRRFYGLPLPFYPCDCGHLTVVGSKQELGELCVDKKLLDKVPHLHRPYIDTILVKCKKCGKPVRRVTDVGDCWLDAGIAPFVTAAKDYFPFEVVIEMKEQIRLWFYAQFFMSVVLTGNPPYEKVVGYGRILDEKGGMFSKSGPNNIPFDEAIEKYGADVTRFLFSGGNQANDLRFGQSLIDETRRKLLGVYNNFVFFETYYKIDKPNIVSHNPKAKDLSNIDMWLVETLNDYIRTCTNAYSNHTPHLVVSATEKLCEDLSNFYIRVNRRRFWKNSNDGDKLNAYWILYHTLKSICLCMAPITPFLSENIWQNIIRKVDPSESELCMTADFAKPCDRKTPIKNIKKHVEEVQQIISLALSLRARENLKLRQPLRTLYINSKNTEAIDLFGDIIREEVNVKTLEIVTSDDRFNTPFLSVNFKVAGAKLKDKVQLLKKSLGELSDADMAKAVASHKKGKVTIGEFKNLSADVFVLGSKSRGDFVSVSEGDLGVVLDTAIDAELVEEGYLRELIRGVQVARQNADFDITARIILVVKTDEKDIQNVIAKYKDKISEEVLATKFVTDCDSKCAGRVSSHIDIEGKKVEICIKLA